MKRLCVLVGGLDSAVLSAHAARQGWRGFPLYIREGCRWEAPERRALQQFFSRLPRRYAIAPMTTLVLPLTFFNPRHWSRDPRAAVPGAKTRDAAVYLPGRNLGLLTLGGLFCAARDIPVLALGTLKNNPFPDSRKNFLNQMERTIKIGMNHALSIRTPFAHLRKAEVIRLGRAWPIHLTLSCLNPKGLAHCGRCNKCEERRKGFRLAGVADRTSYSR